MEAKMTIKTRKEILSCVRNRYNQASWSEKKKILDELVATTSYRRKYAIYLLNDKRNEFSTTDQRQLEFPPTTIRISLKS